MSGEEEKISTRTVIAFAVAPLTPLAILIIALGGFDAKLVLLMLLFSMPFSYLPLLAIGMLGRRYFTRYYNAPNVIIVGMIAGMLLFLCCLQAVSLLLESLKSSTSMLDLGWGGALGAATALTFSLISGLPWKKPATKEPA